MLDLANWFCQVLVAYISWTLVMVNKREVHLDDNDAEYDSSRDWLGCKVEACGNQGLG